MKKAKLASLIDDFCESFNTKEADDLSVENSMPNISTNIGNSLLKVASLIRDHESDVTYEDLHEAIKNHE